MARDNRVNFLVWMLAGMGVGAVLALLFAPQTGRQTRRMIARTAEKGRDYLADRAEEVRERAEQIKERGRDLVDRGREAAEDVAGILDRSVKRVRS